MEMEIKIENGLAEIYTPYNPEFVKKIKGIGGAKWNGSKKCWTIPENAVDAAREIMQQVYGCSDISENETISLRLKFDNRISADKQDIVMFGKILAHATGRNSGAKVGEDVAYTSGGATSGGSVKNWESVVKEGSIVTLSNVNKNLYEKYKDAYDGGITIEVISEEKSKKSLLEEKERLLKRLAEIDAMLASEN